jgi:hypothetical protein
VSKAAMCHVRGGFHASKGRGGLARNNRISVHENLIHKSFAHGEVSYICWMNLRRFSCTPSPI